MEMKALLFPSYRGGGFGHVGRCLALADELEPLIPRFRQVWLARNRSGGLKDSAARFEDLLAKLREE